jgi:hypothetical protein
MNIQETVSISPESFQMIEDENTVRKPRKLCGIKVTIK